MQFPSPGESREIKNMKTSFIVSVVQCCLRISFLETYFYVLKNFFFLHIFFNFFWKNKLKKIVILTFFRFVEENSFIQKLKMEQPVILLTNSFFNNSLGILKTIEARSKQYLEVCI